MKIRGFGQNWGATVIGEGTYTVYIANDGILGIKEGHMTNGGLTSTYEYEEVRANSQKTVRVYMNGVGGNGNGCLGWTLWKYTTKYIN